MRRWAGEDLSAQTERVAGARADLASALRQATKEAEAAARAAESRAKRPGPVDLVVYLAAHQVVLRCEEALDLAELDLRTAAGEDA